MFSLLLSNHAFAQRVPFFYPGATAFTPEISVVNTGALLDVQATVSTDQKHVTMTMRASNSKLLALREFNFQQGPALGNVGDPPARVAANNVPAGANALSRDDPANAVRSSPTEILAYARAQASVLHKVGMSRVSDLKD